jgi:hypothetical protein
MEYHPLTLDELKKVLGSAYEEFKGNFPEPKFQKLLDKYKFDPDDIDRELLRIALKKEGFFEQAKGIFIISL